MTALEPPAGSALPGLAEYLAAASPLLEWIAGAEAVVLLEAVHQAGLFDAFTTPIDPAGLAASGRLDRAAAQALCQALHVHGVLERHGEHYQLSPQFAALLAPDAPQPLADLLARSAARRRALTKLARPDVHDTALPPEDRLAIARGAGISATSPAGQRLAATLTQGLPELATMLESGHHLEVGCGVGNMLLSLATSFPHLTLVGLDIDPATLAEARRRTHALGLTDRVELRHQDARELTDVGTFDVAQWSQFFFPADGRATILAAVHRALKPGGYLLCPILAPDHAGPPAASRAAAISGLIFTRCGVPIRDGAELATEVQHAGFDIVRVIDGPPNPLMLSTAVLLAQRPPTPITGGKPVVAIEESVAHARRAGPRTGRPAELRLAGMAADLDGAPDDRPPLVLLPGLTFDRGIWRPALDALSRIDPGRRVLVLDLPGHGHSPDQLPHSMPRIVGLIHAAVEEAGLDPPVLVGHSMSAGLASVYAAHHPARGVVNVDAPPQLGPFVQLLQSVADQVRGPGLPQVWNMMVQSFHLELLPTPTQQVVRSTSHPDPELIRGYWQQLLDTTPDEIDAWLTGELTRVAAAAVPYLLILGAQLPPDLLEWITATIPQANVEVWPNSGHFPHLAYPDRFAARLAATAGWRPSANPPALDHRTGGATC